MRGHHNYEYAGGTPNIPVAAGDRYYAQDQIRDFWYLMDMNGLSLKDIFNSSKIIIRGFGLSSSVGVLQIATGIGYVNFSVLIPNDGVVPPAVVADDVRFVRIETPAINVPYTSTGAVLDGVTVNYIKFAYAESDGSSRTRAKATGSYPFERRPSYLLTVSPVAPTAYELCVGSVVTNGATSTFGSVNMDPVFIIPLSAGVAILSVAPTAGTWTNKLSWGRPYKIKDTWRLQFMINGSVAAGVATLNMAITGVTFKSSSFIEDIGLVSSWTTQTALKNVQGACMPVAGTNQVAGIFPNNQTNWIFQGDFELTSKPSWL